MRDMLVWPRDDGMRKHLRHPTGRRFENHPDGTPWPADQFTTRRVAEGSVLAEDPRQQKSAEPRQIDRSPLRPRRAPDDTDSQR